MHFLLKMANFRQFFLIFSRTVFCKGLRFFLRCVQCPKTLNLSYQKQHSEKIKFFTIRGVPYGQKLPGVEKKVKQISKKKIIRVKNGTRKWVVEVVSSQVVLSDTV